MRVMQGIAIGALVIAAGGMIWAGAAPSSSAAAVVEPAMVPARPMPATTPTAPAAAPHADLPAPADVPQAEWDRLVAALKNTPNGKKDIQQAGEYLTFQHRAEKWKQSRAAGESAEQRRALDQFLLADLPRHVERGEMTGWEATSMGGALLQDGIGDPAQLKMAEKDLQSRLIAAAPQPDPAAQRREAAQMSAYKAQEAAIVARWQAMPAGQRDQAWLEAQLDQARQQTLDGAGG